LLAFCFLRSSNRLRDWSYRQQRRELKQPTPIRQAGLRFNRLAAVQTGERGPKKDARNGPRKTQEPASMQADRSGKILIFYVQSGAASGGNRQRLWSPRVAKNREADE